MYNLKELLVGFVAKVGSWLLLTIPRIKIFCIKQLQVLKSIPYLVKSLIIGAVLLISVFVVFVLLDGFQQFVLTMDTYHPGNSRHDSTSFVKEFKMLETETVKVNAKLNALTPKSYYLIINSTSNEFFLYKGLELTRTGKCSTGSYLLLENNENQKWLFKTPKGEFRILGKKTDPVWKKPDWAFVEDGLPIPSVNANSRYEYGVLGDYALILGHGYMIHGTLYQRFLGLPVTHGCVRLNDDDLSIVYHAMNVGSKVFIY